MGLDDYRQTGEDTQKQTHVTMANPDHPDTSPSQDDEDAARQHFRAAKSVQDSRFDRVQLVGDFLVAFEAEHIQGEEEALEEFFEIITE